MQTKAGGHQGTWLAGHTPLLPCLLVSAAHRGGSGPGLCNTNEAHFKFEEALGVLSRQQQDLSVPHLPGFEDSQDNNVEVKFFPETCCALRCPCRGRREPTFPPARGCVGGRGEEPSQLTVITDPKTVASHPSQAMLALSPAERPGEPHSPGRQAGRRMSQQAAAGKC